MSAQPARPEAVASVRRIGLYAQRVCGGEGGEGAAERAERARRRRRAARRTSRGAAYRVEELARVERAASALGHEDGRRVARVRRPVAALGYEHSEERDESGREPEADVERAQQQTQLRAAEQRAVELPGGGRRSGLARLGHRVV